MKTFWAYLKRRAPEPFTWFGLLLIVAAAALFWYYRDHAVSTGSAAAAGAALAALPDRLLKLSELVERIASFLPKTSAARAAASEPKDATMAGFNTLSEILGELPDFEKIIKDGAQIALAVESKDYASIITGFPTYEADVVKVVNDIMALGVAKAQPAAAPLLPPIDQPA